MPMGIRILLQQPKARTVVLVSVFVLLSAAIILRIVTPHPAVTSVAIQKLDTSQAISFQQTTISLPPTLPTTPPQLQFSKASAIPLDASVFLKLFKTPVEGPKNFWSDSDSNQSLAYEPYQKRFHYYNNAFSGDFDAATQYTIQLDRALETAKSFVSKQMGITTFTPVQNNIVFTRKDIPEADPNNQTPKDQANVVIIPFAFLINGNPVYTNLSMEYPIVVWVDSVDNVLRVEANDQLFLPGDIQNVYPLSPTDAITQAKSTDSFSIISVLSDPQNGFDVHQVQSATVTRVSLEYRFMEATKMIIPMYRMYGTLVTSDNKQVDADFLVPAMKTQ